MAILKIGRQTLQNASELFNIFFSFLYLQYAIGLPFVYQQECQVLHQLSTKYLFFISFLQLFQLIYHSPITSSKHFIVNFDSNMNYLSNQPIQRQRLP